MTRETKNGIHLFVHRAFQVTDCVRVKYSVTVRKFSVSISALVIDFAFPWAKKCFCGGACDRGFARRL